MRYGSKTTFEERVDAVYLTISRDKDHQGASNKKQYTDITFMQYGLKKQSLFEYHQGTLWWIDCHSSYQ